MKIIFTVLVIIFCAFNLSAQSIITQQEYDFYSSILSKKYVINRTTQDFILAGVKSAQKKMRKVPKELFQQFEIRNRISYQIENKLSGFRFTDEPRPNYDKRKEINFVFDEVAMVSRVAFTKDESQALVFCSYYSEATSGASSNIYWFVKVNGKWEERGAYAPWIH